MTNNPLHDFKTAEIKHIIEKEFYQYAGKVLGDNVSCSIVTGPDHERHIKNAEEYINLSSKPTIYEINIDTFIDIYAAYKNNKRAKVLNTSIENANSRFIDCDLTCISDADVIINTLLSQIKTQANSASSKIFIFSMAARKADEKIMIGAYKKILGLLGSYVNKFGKKQDIIIKNRFNYLKEITIQGTKGRLVHYISYLYNSGGGPMYTCLLHYR